MTIGITMKARDAKAFMYPYYEVKRCQGVWLEIQRLGKVKAQVIHAMTGAWTKAPGENPWQTQTRNEMSSCKFFLSYEVLDCSWTKCT